MTRQEFEIPTVGFQLSKNLRGTIVLLISHTGGTFATISTANLLRNVTPNLFAVTENWDSLLARSILKGDQVSTAVPCRAAPRAVPHRRVPCRTVPCSPPSLAVPCRAVPSLAVPCRSVPLRASPRQLVLSLIHI